PRATSSRGSRVELLAPPWLSFLPRPDCPFGRRRQWGGARGSRGARWALIASGRILRTVPSGPGRVRRERRGGAAVRPPRPSGARGAPAAHLAPGFALLAPGQLLSRRPGTAPDSVALASPEAPGHGSCSRSRGGEGKCTKSGGQGLRRSTPGS